MTADRHPLASTWLPLLHEALVGQGSLRMPLRGNSMLPTLPTQCEIEVIPLSEPPALGDLIVFVAGDALVAHRLVRRSGGRLIAQGDHRLGPDSPLTHDQILGRVAGAYVDAQRVWPTPTALRIAWFWQVRYQGLRGARLLARLLRRFRRTLTRQHV